ncbi:MAG: amidase [Deltaproteobacteria bacterium]|jgi:amidase|nr:amidase [Deltaproteobacteria bacterium]MBW2498174.1 amidase [Deltaproteobacteria bacterium]
MTDDDLARLDATAQAALVQSGECTPTELVEAAIERIERVDPKINCVVISLYERAREQLERGLGEGPFRGVPLLLKDLGCHQAGVPVYGGTNFLKQRSWKAGVDSVLAQRFEAAGFVVVGKTNTPELGLSPTTEPESFGPTRNPWNPDRIVGGSSGGSAAAVAAGLVPVAHAGDGGGSIRNPAGACALVGLKPSRGRVSAGPEHGEGWGGAVTELVVTRSVRDTAGVLDCVAGPASGDPYHAPPPPRPFVAELGVDPPPLRVGLFSSNAITPAHPEAVIAVTRAGDLLAELGHRVDESHPAALDETTIGELSSIPVASSVARQLDAFAEMTGDVVTEADVEPATWAMAQRGWALSAPEYLRAHDALHGYGRRLRSWWREVEGEEGYDILVTPTMAEPPPPIGSLKGADVERIVRLVPYTMPYNLSGQPAIGLPLHWTPEGLPLGIQLVGAYGSESTLIRLASQIERAQPWQDRRAPIHA